MKMESALIEGQIRAVALMVCRGKAELKSCSTNGERAPASGRLDALIEEVQELIADFDVEVRCAALGWQYSARAREHRSLILAAEAAYQEEAGRAIQAARKAAPEGEEWTIDLASEQVVEPLRQEFGRKVRELGLCEKVWKEKPSGFVAEFKARAREAVFGPGPVRRHPFLEAIEARVREAEELLTPQNEERPQCRHCGRVRTGGSFR